ncbi:MAG: acyl-CoA dehydrogenase, partial [Brevundimonas sp.]|nr:acyl-CoA dehydrogenase [Brevundimonas sp.]
MDFGTSDIQRQIGEAITKLCEPFDDDYWLSKDRDGGFPHDFHKAMADQGWLGVAMPTELGGAGLGISEAAVVVQSVSQSGAGFSGASAIHLNIFGLNPVVVFGSDQQKQRMLPSIISGEQKACFAVTEPDSGLNTTHLSTFAEKHGDHYVVRGQKIWISTAQVASKVLLLARTTPLADVKSKTDGLSLFFTDLDRRKIDVSEIPKMGRSAVDCNLLFIDGLEAPEDDLIGEEGNGFNQILHGLNPERILIAAEAVGLGRAALRKASQYA